MCIPLLFSKTPTKIMQICDPVLTCCKVEVFIYSSKQPANSSLHVCLYLCVFLSGKVLKWVEEAVQSSKVHLLSTDHYTPVSNTWRIPFDPSLKEVTVALSGPAPNIEIRNPHGRYRVGTISSFGINETPLSIFVFRMCELTSRHCICFYCVFLF